MSDSHTEGFTKLHDGHSYGYRWTGPKWQCETCKRSGYGTSEAPYSWANACARGHSPCPYCGRQLALCLDGTPRVHARCPDRPDDAELLRLIAAEVKHDARLGVRGPLDRQATALLARLTRGGVA